jgi:hypothetical protein
MRYLLLIHDDPKSREHMSADELGEFMAEYRRLSEDLTASGHYVSGSELQPATTATRVQVREGRRLVTDGPFAETREQLGGYYLVEATDLDEAIAIAARIPSARLGTIEVRPLVPSAVPAVA